MMAAACRGEGYELGLNVQPDVGAAPNTRMAGSFAGFGEDAPPRMEGCASPQ
jgi:hypothetical protein